MSATLASEMFSGSSKLPVIEEELMMELQNTFASLTTPYVLGYWALAGLACVVLFFVLNGTVEQPKQFGSSKTPLSRGLFYFIFGGAILPMAFLIILPVVPLGLLGELQERKRQTRKLLGEVSKT